MKFYELPATLGEDIKILDDKIREFKAGLLQKVLFRGNRVSHGIYEQRKPDTYMLRIRCAAGGITPVQLRKVAELSETYGAEKLHVTTRQELQIQYVKIEKVVHIINLLAEAGLSSRGGGGNTVRNIIVPSDTGVLPGETFDVGPYAMALTTRMIAESDSWNLPRKYKIAFSNTDVDRISASVTDLGFFAKIKDNEKGFRVYCAASMGAVPRTAHILFDWVPEDKVYCIVKALKIMFDNHGNRRNKHRSRIKFLWEKLGEEKFREIFTGYYNDLLEKNDPGLAIGPLENKANIKEGFKPENPTDNNAFAIWKDRTCQKQKQAGLFMVRIPLGNGDILNKDAQKLADFLENFGENSIRLTTDQNILLRNIPEQYLGNVYNVVNIMNTLSHRPAIIGNMVNCIGADTCTLGICLSRNASLEIQKKLLSSDLDLDALEKINIRISGCPNSCGCHHIGDLGFFGRVGKKDHEMYPSYVILAGAKFDIDGSRYAEKLDVVAAKQLPEFIYRLLKEYENSKNAYNCFRDFVLSGYGREFVKQICDQYREKVPSFIDDESFYRDWGETERFSILKGQVAECSAGMFDMIDFDFNEIKRFVNLLNEQGISNDQKKDALYGIMVHSSRSLLITRGLSASSDEDVFTKFIQFFINEKYVPEYFLPVIENAKSRDLDFLLDRQVDVIQLSGHMERLYKSMDDSLKFTSPENIDTELDNAPVSKTNNASENQVADDSAETCQRIIPDVTKDFRGVACPMNFVKTKLALSPMQSGKILEILLDDGQPMENVPRSVKSEGHEILMETQNEDSSWSVFIKKI